MPLAARATDDSRIPWSILAPGIGLSFVAIHVFHLIAHDESLLSSVLGAVLPLSIAVVVVTAGVWAHEQGFSASTNRLIASWTILGTAIAGALAGLVLLHGAVDGVNVDAAVFLVASIATVGAAAGVLIGVNDALRRRRVEQIASLQRATGRLLAAESPEAVAQQAVRIATDVLDLGINGVWLANDEGSALHPAAISRLGETEFEEIPVYRPGNSLSWDVFETGDVEQYSDLSDRPGIYDPSTRVRSEIVLPLGVYGVMNVGSVTADSFDETDVTLAKLLAETTTAALERADRDEQLELWAADLERQNDRLDRFASVVSHDLRNPLSVARGYTDLARASMGDGDVAGATEHLDRVASAHERMDRLIEDLLALARSGGPVEEPDRVRLADAARETWSLVDTADATLALGDGVDGAVVLADRTRLRQALENLFRNAVEHGGGAVTVTVEVTTDGFAVADDGPGVPTADREKVFETGFTTGGDGVGLGLATVRQIADDHGWEVALADGSDGARFEFTGVEFDGSGDSAESADSSDSTDSAASAESVVEPE